MSTSFYLVSAILMMVALLAQFTSYPIELPPSVPPTGASAAPATGSEPARVGLEAGIALPDVLPSAALRPVHFNKPTSGNDAYNGFSDTHPGIDMSDMSAG